MGSVIPLFHDVELVLEGQITEEAVIRYVVE